MTSANPASNNGKHPRPSRTSQPRCSEESSADRTRHTHNGTSGDQASQAVEKLLSLPTAQHGDGTTRPPDPDRLEHPDPTSPRARAAADQQRDIAVLRLALMRCLHNHHDAAEQTDIRELSGSELHQAASAMMKMHADQRESILFADEQHDNAHTHAIARLLQLSDRQLIDLARQERIDLPPGTTQRLARTSEDDTGHT